MSAANQGTAADDHARSLLSAEELAAMDDPEAGADAAAGAGDADDDPNEANEAETAAASAPAPAPAPAASEEDAPAPAAAPTPAAQGQQPGYHAEVPADFEDQVKAIDTERADLRAKFKAGDIDLDEYEEQRAAIDDRRRALDKAALKAEVSAEMTEQNARAQWQRALQVVAAHAKTAEGGGIDYGSDQAKANDFDMFARAIGAAPENREMSAEMIAREAHKRVLALHDIAPAKPAASAPAPAPAKQEKPPKRSPDLSVVPKTLAGVPGGDAPGDIGSEFDGLDGLHGEDLESAIGRLTPAQRDRYRAGR